MSKGNSGLLKIIVYFHVSFPPFQRGKEDFSDVNFDPFD